MFLYIWDMENLDTTNIKYRVNKTIEELESKNEGYIMFDDLSFFNGIRGHNTFAYQGLELCRLEMFERHGTSFALQLSSEGMKMKEAGFTDWYSYQKSLEDSWIKKHYMKVFVIPTIVFGLSILGYYIKVQIDKDQQQTMPIETSTHTELLKQESITSE